MHSAGELCAIFSPAVNSYKRINAPITASGATWSPNTVTYSGNNRTHMVRVPEAGRFEFRLMDGSAHPYLMQAALLAAGLDGIENASDPGPELVGNAYAAGEAESFPSSLREAVAGWESSEFAKRVFGSAVWQHYLNYGRTEQRLFDEVVTDYERARMFERG